MPIAMHYEKQNKKSTYIFYGLLIALAIYGFYKNGLTYVFMGKMNLIEASKPIVFLAVAILGRMLYNFLKKQPLTKHLYEGILLGLITPVNFPIWLYILLVVLYFALKYIRLRVFVYRILFFKLLLILTGFLFHVTYENAIEVATPYLYGILDVFLGRAVGNFGTTSILLLICCYAFFSYQIYYKKEIPIAILTSYAIILFLLEIIFPTGNYFLNLLNSHVWFMAIFLSPINEYSPVSKKGLMFYGIFLGSILAFCYHFWHFENSSYLILAVFQVLCFLLRPIYIKKKAIL